jgi:hypothetical protein
MYEYSLYDLGISYIGVYLREQKHICTQRLALEYLHQIRLLKPKARSNPNVHQFMNG